MLDPTALSRGVAGTFAEGRTFSLRAAIADQNIVRPGKLPGAEFLIKDLPAVLIVVC